MQRCFGVFGASCRDEKAGTRTPRLLPEQPGVLPSPLSGGWCRACRRPGGAGFRSRRGAVHAAALRWLGKGVPRAAPPGGHHEDRPGTGERPDSTAEPPRSTRTRRSGGPTTPRRGRPRQCVTAPCRRRWRGALANNPPCPAACDARGDVAVTTPAPSQAPEPLPRCARRVTAVGCSNRRRAFRSWALARAERAKPARTGSTEELRKQVARMRR